jgi:hypothetical protein
VSKKHKELLERLEVSLQPCFVLQLKILYKKAVHKFQTQSETIEASHQDFFKQISGLQDTVLGSFKTAAQDSLLTGAPWSYDDVYEELRVSIGDKISNRIQKEIKRMTEEMHTVIRSTVSKLVLQILDSREYGAVFWENAFRQLNEKTSSIASEYIGKMKGLSLSEDQLKQLPRPGLVSKRDSKKRWRTNL